MVEYKGAWQQDRIRFFSKGGAGMAFDQSVVEEIISVADEASIARASLLAVVEVESGGKAFSDVNGQAMPLILYEYHVFYRNLPVAKRPEAVSRNLARRKWKELPYKKTQTARYAQLERAKSIDAQAAYAACSWGVGQVLGENASWLGYANAEALATEAMSGVAGQVRVMLRFIRRKGLMDELNQREWRAFARAYNGAGQVDIYGPAMARAFARHAKLHPAPALAAVDQDDLILRMGQRGDAVAALQRSLRALGYHLIVDGDFGPATKRMVARFQADHDLAADGIVGPATWAQIEAMEGRDFLADL